MFEWMEKEKKLTFSLAYASIPFGKMLLQYTQFRLRMFYNYNHTNVQDTQKMTGMFALGLKRMFRRC